MADDNEFFRPVKDFCQRRVVTCTPNDSLVDVVQIMREKNISSLVVCEGDVPTGILTDRDLRNKVVAPGRDPKSLRVSDVMNAPLSVIGESDFLYEALYRMSREGIHRLGVVDADGRLAGIITDTDILRVQAHSPHQLVLDIEKAGTLEELKTLHRRIQALVLHLTGTGIRTRDMVRLIANLNDQILLRLIGLLRENRFTELPQGFAFVVLGSEGRSEQTLSTDQDNALIYADDLSEQDVERIAAFAIALIDSLIEIGVPPCPGGIMAKNPAWRKSLAQWKRDIDHWILTPVPEHVLQGSMFADLRTIYGDRTLEQDLKAHIFAHLDRNEGFLMRMAKNMMGFAPPLGWFGRIKTERKGEHRGMFEIKKAGIFAITDGIKALALQARKLDGGTHKRIAALVAAGVLNPLQADDIEESFEFLVHLRLRGHVQAVRNGKTPTNYIALDQLNRMEQASLRGALEGVAKFQEFVRGHFNLHLLQ